MDIASLSESEKVNLIHNRWKDGDDLWSKISESYKKGKALWSNTQEDVTPKTKSQSKDNRTFLATETVLNNLLGKPSKPNVMPANETPESKEIADNLQAFFIEKYKKLKTKKKVRRALRTLFFSRVFVLKAYWDKEIDDFNFTPKDPRNVRLRKTVQEIFTGDLEGKTIKVIHRDNCAEFLS